MALVLGKDYAAVGYDELVSRGGAICEVARPNDFAHHDSVSSLISDFLKTDKVGINFFDYHQDAIHPFLSDVLKPYVVG